jgi:transposase-like protein
VSKLGKEQVMAAQAMVSRGTSVRRVAEQMGVTEGALRYRLKKRSQGEQPDGRAKKATSVDGFEEAVETILDRSGYLLRGFHRNVPGPCRTEEACP